MPAHMMDGSMMDVRMMDSTMLVCTIAASLLSVPLTMVMELVDRHFVVGARHPLPPTEPTPETAEEDWFGGQGDERQPLGVPLIALLAHGVLAGAACLSFGREMPLLLVLGVVAPRMVVWAESRLAGLVFAAGSVASARHPGQRNILVAVHGAHALWGAMAAWAGKGF